MYFEPPVRCERSASPVLQQRGGNAPARPLPPAHRARVKKLPECHLQYGIGSLFCGILKIFGKQVVSVYTREMGLPSTAIIPV